MSDVKPNLLAYNIVPTPTPIGVPSSPLGFFLETVSKKMRINIPYRLD